MKLSEAIMLGDSLKKSSNAVWLHRGDGQCFGCAIGGALLAIGEGENYMKPSSGPMKDFIVRLWPWVTLTFLGEVSHRYFAVLDGTETLDQLCHWVKTVEPAEDADAARVLGERDHADRGSGPDSSEARAELLRVGAEGTRP
jgi:hypothetical protein